MGKKYKLLKDLPGYEAGTVFEITNDNRLMHSFGPDGQIVPMGRTYMETMIKGSSNRNDQNWFEPVPDPTPATRFLPERGQMAWYIQLHAEDIKVREFEVTTSYTLEDGDLNVFETEAQAEAMALAMQLLFAYVQEFEPQLGESRASLGKLHNQLNEAAMDARKMVWHIGRQKTYEELAKGTPFQGIFIGNEVKPRGVK